MNLVKIEKGGIGYSASWIGVVQSCVELRDATHQVMTSSDVRWGR